MTTAQTGTTVQIDGPTNILVIEGLTMAEAKPEYIADIGRAAPTDSTIQVVGSVKEAAAYAADVEVILGVVNQRLFADTPKLRWVHATASGVDMFMFDDFINSDVVLTGEKDWSVDTLPTPAWGYCWPSPARSTAPSSLVRKPGPIGWGCGPRRSSSKV